MSKRKLRIAVNAQIPLGSGSGGIETVLRVLTLIGQLDGDEEYVFIGHWKDPFWLRPFLNERQTVISAPGPADYKSSAGENWRRKLGFLRPVASKIKNALMPVQSLFGLPVSNGFYESLDCDVIHFPYQDYTRCRIPSIYNPHDLQHVHYPHYFSSDELERREKIYPAACRQADTVIVASQFVRQDLIDHYSIDPSKIQIIPWAPPEKVAEKDALRLKNKYEISVRPFVLYPAMTWEHKNHIRLLEAIAMLRDRHNLIINLVCTGHRNSFFAQIEKRLRELKLEEQVRFLGMVTYEELSSLYLQAEFVVIPTLFEAASGPLFESWMHNVPVACSSVTSLPEQAAGAALLFNPFSVEEIAGTLKKMTQDHMLRETLRRKGTARLQDFNLERMSKTYRAVYRKSAGLTLNEEDRDLLAA